LKAAERRVWAREERERNRKSGIGGGGGGKDAFEMKSVGGKKGKDGRAKGRGWWGKGGVS